MPKVVWQTSLLGKDLESVGNADSLTQEDDEELQYESILFYILSIVTQKKIFF